MIACNSNHINELDWRKYGFRQLNNIFYKVGISISVFGKYFSHNKFNKTKKRWCPKDRPFHFTIREIKGVQFRSIFVDTCFGISY